MCINGGSMATYIFECAKCKNAEEREILMQNYEAEKENQICKCGNKMQRVFQPIGATIYNCSGFYDTDSRKVRSR